MTDNALGVVQIGSDVDPQFAFFANELSEIGVIPCAAFRRPALELDGGSMAARVAAITHGGRHQGVASLRLIRRRVAHAIQRWRKLPPRTYT